MPSLWGFNVSFCFVLQVTSSSDGIPVKRELPLLRQRSVASAGQLMPFFETLSCAFKAQHALPTDARAPPAFEFPATDGPGILKQLEECVECDFLEHPDC